MTAQQKLVLVKVLHTLIWVIFNIVFGYLAYAVIIFRIDRYFYWAVGLILAECLVLVLLKWTCPLTLIARRYSDSERDNFDIYLPNWLAKHNKTIYSTLFVIIMLVFLYNYLNT